MEGTDRNGGRQVRVIDDEDGFVVVDLDREGNTETAAVAAPLPPPNRRASPGVRVVSPNRQEEEEEEVPRAHAEESFPSPRRRTTPTSRRRQSHRVTYEDLVGRPRSNPRARTPMRYESPLEHGAFRNASREEEEPQDAFQPRTISIRPNAGLGVGVLRAQPERVNFDDTNQRPKPITLKSQKQGPSKRKTRRWNNDNFHNTFHDLANSGSAKARAAAEVLARAKADAKHFLPVYDPADTQRSAEVTRFMEDKSYSDVRDRFFRGELHAKTQEPRIAKRTDPADASAAELFQRIEGRLRRVVVKACENSGPACKVVESFENYLIRSLGEEEPNVGNDEGDFWEGILVERPNYNPQQGTVTFRFDGDSSSGGFHRLLVHAVCQFHCLKAKTSTASKARVLSVSGVMRGSQYRLLDYLMSVQQERQ
ncbi:expressed unknown protein [Seminavis robusta]|uniref:R3H-associated N-terminal domain-containing protein n=1 Tax=Seminavis robusta TaxID=568900 RepID=A0A9N8EWZ1_9STRA|nr:expressed unknown protein [Seminavis robusta]|eukprot:Sro1799_g298410.1 n/a (424) ;mRNA; f:18638-20002